jgi:hypothetical protein
MTIDDGGKARGSGWLRMDAYPDKGQRDASGKWVDEEGPQVQLLMEDGSEVTARWYGAKTTGGGEAWAWWVDGNPRGIGLYEPIAWRPLTYPVQLRRRDTA